MKYYVYKTTNKVNGKIYIGYHASENIEKDSYLGSGYILHRAIRSHGRHNFEREILFEFDTREEATKKEREIVNEEFIKQDDNYNLALGGFGGGLPGDKNPFFGKHHTEETKEKLRISSSNKRHTEETKEKISESLRANEEFMCKIKSKEHGEKISRSLKNSEAHRLSLHNPERRRRLLEANIGRKHSEESKQKMSENSKIKGKKRSLEFCLNLSRKLKGREHPWQDKVNKNPEKIEKTRQKHLGSKRTTEQCKNISESIKGKRQGSENHMYSGDYVTPYGIFSSLKSAASSVGNSEICIRDRCKTKNKNKITENSVRTDPKITKDMVGKTWEEVGWTFLPK